MSFRNRQHASRHLALHATEDLLSKRFEDARSTHLGYPYNLKLEHHDDPKFGKFLINNLGDPYSGSHYGIEVCDLERDVIRWFMDLWRCQNHDDYWGAVGASGTEGNLWGAYIGREVLSNATLVHSSAAHYSLPKAARILRLPSISINCDKNDAIDTEDLRRKIIEAQPESIILALTCGTTMAAAHDNIVDCCCALDELGYDATRRYIHVDGALDGMIIPFVPSASPEISPNFKLPIDSISTSGHKMVGVPMPCGVLVVRRCYIDKITSAISYLKSNDTTLMGSRNGHATLAIWRRIQRHGYEGYCSDVEACLLKAAHMEDRLGTARIPVFRNLHAITVVFPEPSVEIVNKYQLACHNGRAHAITMPNVTTELIAKFTADYLKWWQTGSEERSKLMEAMS
ncbi:histidine decarboxylase [Acidocella facilis]|uniref:histidine decarboxylase n=1 Tax=Acidocella facilis TaxID=525 RepID=UPI001F1F444D|nr:histidine decarboxylase [Acidocella facilis]